MHEQNANDIRDNEIHCVSKNCTLKFGGDSTELSLNFRVQFFPRHSVHTWCDQQWSIQWVMIVTFCPNFRLRNDLYCVGCGVKLNSLTHFLLTLLFPIQLRLCSRPSSLRA